MRADRGFYRMAFTLTELMVGVTIASLLILGVNKVFMIATTTIGAGMGLSEANRGLRAAEAALRSDFEGDGSSTTGIVRATNAPCVVLRSQNTTAFLDREREVLNNPQPFRTDVFSFFAQGAFQRQTGQYLNGRAEYLCRMDPLPTEAWIYYGHANLPNNNPVPHPVNDFFAPGAGNAASNPNNFHANRWVLGRVAMLFRERDWLGNLNDGMGMQYIVVTRSASASEWDLNPLCYNAELKTTKNWDDDPLPTTPGRIQYGWSDLACTSLGEYRTAISRSNSRGTAWWQSLSQNSSGGAYRFNCQPMPSQAGSTEDRIRAMNAASTYLLGSCPQFIVEFAGDFLQQNAGTGAVTNKGTDGQIDFIISGGQRRVRWYGLARDINGDGTINATDDVVPLKNVYTSGLSFEKTVSTNLYECAWGVSELGSDSLRPRMFRIVIQATDQNGRLGDGIRREFVFLAPK